MKRIQNSDLVERIKKLGCVIDSQECQGITDIDHVSTYGSGGRDYVTYDKRLLLNLMPLCRKHHTEKGQIGYKKMIEKYPRYFEWLLDEGREDILERSKK